MESLTPVQEGIFVTIDPIQLEIMKVRFPGFLERDHYDAIYDRLAVENEVGRYMFLRFLQE